MVLTTPALRARLDAGGTRLVYEDRKGYENELRKHHASSIARDVWMCNLQSGEHTRLTEFVGEDRNPHWSAERRRCASCPSVPGTATAVWWENLFTGDLVFGIPQVGTKGADGKYLENQQLEPTHMVRLDPEDSSAGRDTQIIKAVEVLLEEID